MSDKNMNILKIVLLSVGVIVLTAFMVFVIVFRNTDFTFNIKDNYKLVYDEVYSFSDINLIDADLTDADIFIRYSDTKDVRVQVYDKDDTKFKVNLDNSTLNINYDVKLSFCFGLCYFNRKVVINVPEEYEGEFNIKTASGEVEVDSFLLSKMEIVTASGDVIVKGASKATIKTVSGEVNSINIPNLNVKTTSGDIEAANVETVVLSSTSGDAQVRNLNGMLEITTVSGDVDIVAAQLTSNSKISTVSGEVEIEGINSVYVSTSTVSGDVDVYNSDRYSQTTLNIKTTSGDIEVK